MNLLGEKSIFMKDIQAKMGLKVRFSYKETASGGLFLIQSTCSFTHSGNVDIVTIYEPESQAHLAATRLLVRLHSTPPLIHTHPNPFFWVGSRPSQSRHARSLHDRSRTLCQNARLYLVHRTYQARLLLRDRPPVFRLYISVICSSLTKQHQYP